MYTDDECYLRCNATIVRRGKSLACTHPAGYFTSHQGYGHCYKHHDHGESEGWKLAQEIAEQLEISPWEALLLGVRASAAKLAWIELQFRDCIERHFDDPDAPQIKRWLRESRAERQLMARISKAAIDAGISAALARQLEMEGQLLATALDAALTALPHLTAEERINAISAAQQTLFTVTEH